MTDIIRKIMGAGLFLLAFSLVCGNEARAQSCLTPPSCDTLGYKQTADDCSGQERVLKCPFDQTKMFCLDTITQNLEVGAILYSDMTVTTGIVTGKTPIGVVFDTNKRLAVAIDQSSSTLTFGGYGTDIPSLVNCTSEPLSCGTDGKANTAAIIAYGKSNGISYPAAEYCNKYTTTGTKAGDWHLPSYAELKSIYNAKSMINATLSLLGKSSLTESYYWSSTEYGSYGSWILCMNNGSNSYDNKNYYYYVRPVLAF